LRKDIFQGIVNIKVLQDELMSAHTSFHIGGKADYFVRVFSKEALLKVLARVKGHQLNYYVIGNGTNLLVSDKGLVGVVVKLEGNFQRIYQRGDRFLCGGGVMLSKLLARATRVGYGGIEFLAGIPGTTAGAIKGNAGAFSHAIAEVIEEVSIIDKNLKERVLKNEQLGFGYRRSKIKDGMIITSATFRLRKRNKKEIRRLIARNLKHRCQRQPQEPSCGSFFKNPLGHSAGKLIDECGLRGLRVGDAEVSKKHGNFIINCGQAKAADVIKLARRIKKIVQAKTGVLLKEEVRRLG